MRSLGLTARMLLAAAAVAVLMASTLAVLLVAIGEQQDALSRARHANRVIVQAGALQDQVLDLGSGARGFVLTGNPSQLEPWRRARRTVEGEADLLEALVAGDPAQVRALARSIAREVSAYRTDYADPLVALARRDRAAADDPAHQLDGRTRSRSIRDRITALVAAERGAAERAADDARGAGDTARALGIAALVAAVLTVLALAAYMSRAIVTPVKRVAGQLARLAEGDLSVRAAGGVGEVRVLTDAFNRTAARLEESQSELERHRLEVESQNVELEQQNVELATQQAELERAVADLGMEKGRVEVLYRFGARIAKETEPSVLAEVTLEQLCALSGSQVGILYVASDDPDAGELPVAATRGLPDAGRPAALTPGAGMAGQALRDGRPVQASYPDAPLRVRVLAGEVEVRHETHVPLMHAGRLVALASLARLEDEPFAAAELESVAHLGGQAAVAFSNLAAARSTRREAGISQALFAATPVGIALTDPDGDLLMANERMRALLAGLDLSEEGNLFGMLDRLRPLVAEPQGLAEQAAALADDPAGRAQGELRVRATGRSYVWAHGGVPDPEGRLLGRVMVLREVTAERESQRLRDEFVALVSHKLRTPMTSVLGYLELVLDGDELGEESAELLGIATHNARRLVRLIGDIILVSQSRAGRLTVAMTAVALERIAAEAVEGARPLADDRRVELAVRTPDRPVSLDGDPVRLRQVIDNLVNNAVKYTPAGGRVEVEVSRNGTEACLAVADSGPGIPPEDQDRLFEPFFRSAASAEAIPGSGLGLAVVRAIVEAHRGRVAVESPEAGSRFLVRLPLDVADPAGPAASVVGPR